MSQHGTPTFMYLHVSLNALSVFVASHYLPFELNVFIFCGPKLLYALFRLDGAKRLRYSFLQKAVFRVLFPGSIIYVSWLLSSRQKYLFLMVVG